MKRSFVWLSLLCLLPFTSCTWFSSSSKEGENLTKVGVLIPLTGDLAPYGAAIKNGIELAHSGSPVKDQIKLVFEDEKGDPKTAVTVVNKLLSNDRVDVLIGGASSAVAASIIPVTSKSKKVLISPYATAAELFAEGNFFYSLLPSDNSEGLFMSEYLASQEIDAIGVLYINNDYGAGIVSTFSKECQKRGIRIISSEGYSGGETNFRTQINKLKSLNPKAIYMPGYFTETSIILQQMKELGCEFKIYGSSNFYDPKFLEHPNAEGVVFCYPAFDDSTDTYRTFVENYSTKYEQQPNAFAIQGYNCFKLIEKIVLESNSRGKIDFQADLKKIEKFQGVNGVIHFSPDGSVIKDFNIMEIKNEQFVVK